MRPGIQTLRDVRLLAPFSGVEITALNEAADLARFGPEEVLFRQGERLETLHLLLAGHVAETRMHRDEDALTDVIGPVAPIGFAPTLLDLATPTGARTITSARLILIPVTALRTMIAKNPSLLSSLLDHALVTVRRQAIAMCDLKLKSSAWRLAEFLLRLAEDAEISPVRFVLPYEKRFLAAKIGCSQENLSRAFAALRRLGVETKSSLVVIKDVAALRAFAGMASSSTFCA
jgi:CRP-like cAMP-binding protein